MGERKKGIWADKPRILQLLGSDPASLLRNVAAQPAGLHNLGATCYLNSLMQCLFMIVPFRATVFAWEPPPDQQCNDMIDISDAASDAEMAATTDASESISAASSSAAPPTTCITKAEVMDVKQLQLLFGLMQAGNAAAVDAAAFVRRLGIAAHVQQVGDAIQ